MRLAEGGNGRDAITKPVRLGAGRTAPLWTEVALHNGGTWEGPRKPPRAAAPAGKTRESGPSRKAWHPSWTLQNRAFRLRVRRCGAKGSGAPKSSDPHRVQRLAEAHASPMFLCPTANAIGLGLFTHCEGGKANREGRRENFCGLKNTSGNLKSLNWGIKGHSSSPRCLESRLLIHTSKIRGQLTTHSLHPQSARGSWKSSGIRPISLRRCFSPVSLPQVFWNLSFELAESGREGAGSPSAILRRGCIAGGG